MEPGAFLAVLSLLLLAGLAVLGVFALIVHVQLRDVRRRLERLERAEPSPAPPAVPPTAAPPRAPARAEPEPSRPAPAGLPASAAPARPTPAALEPERPAPAPFPPTPGPIRRASRAPRVDWERWLGVRGAAAVGGVMLALAAILTYQHAVREGWITPAKRVTLGLIGALLCLGGAHVLRRKAVRAIPAALDGAGVVALYAVTWAAFRRYDMIGAGLAFPLMALTTALACALAVVHRAPLTAGLALLGGFATPVLVSTGTDRPISLFGYLLLLDLGLLFVARRRGWTWIVALAIAGTFAYQLLWIGGRADPDEVELALGILAVFAAAFAASVQALPGIPRVVRLALVSSALLLPAPGALTLVGSLEVAAPPWQLGLLFAFLVAGACVVGRAHGAPWLELAASGAGLVVLLAWAMDAELVVRSGGTETVRTGLVVQLAAGVLALAAIPHGFLLADRRRGTLRSGSHELLDPRSVLPASLALALAVWLAASVPAYWTCFGLLAALGAIHAQAGLVKRAPLALLVGGLGTGLALAAFEVEHLAAYGSAAAAAVWPVSALAFGACWLGLAGGWLALGLARTGLEGRAALHAAGLFLATRLVAAGQLDFYASGGAWLLPVLVLASLAMLLLASERLSSAAWYGVAGAVALATLAAWSDERVRASRAAEAPSSLALDLLLVAAAAGLAGLWPALRRAAYRGTRRSWWIGAGLLPLWTLPLEPLFEESLGEAFDFAPPLLLGGLGAAAAWRWRGAWESETGPAARRMRASALVWTGGAAGFLLAAVVPTQLDHRLLPLTLAFGAPALAYLARACEHRWGARVAALIGALGLFGLVVGIGDYERTDAWVLNWMTLDFLGAAVALALLTHALRPGAALGVGGVGGAARLVPGVGAIVSGFLWINLEILNHYADGRWLTLQGHDAPRDLTMSVAWALYALALLTLGTLRSLVALRWASLALLVLAIGKVFLFDLSHLEGLYRVGSLAGLAVSLFLVSIFYQRFVFRRGAAVGA